MSCNKERQICIHHFKISNTGLLSKQISCLLQLGEYLQFTIYMKTFKKGRMKCHFIFFHVNGDIGKK